MALGGMRWLMAMALALLASFDLVDGFGRLTVTTMPMTTVAWPRRFAPRSIGAQPAPAAVTVSEAARVGSSGPIKALSGAHRAKVLAVGKHFGLEEKAWKQLLTTCRAEVPAKDQAFFGRFRGIKELCEVSGLYGPPEGLGGADGAGTSAVLSADGTGTGGEGGDGQRVKKRRRKRRSGEIVAGLDFKLVSPQANRAGIQYFLHKCKDPERPTELGATRTKFTIVRSFYPKMVDHLWGRPLSRGMKRVSTRTLSSKMVCSPEEFLAQSRVVLIGNAGIGTSCFQGYLIARALNPQLFEPLPVRPSYIIRKVGRVIQLYFLRERLELVLRTKPEVFESTINAAIAQSALGYDPFGLCLFEPSQLEEEEEGARKVKARGRAARAAMENDDDDDEKEREREFRPPELKMRCISTLPIHPKSRRAWNEASRIVRYPCWSEYEIDALWLCHRRFDGLTLDRFALRDRRELFGGIPRILFAGPDEYQSYVNQREIMVARDAQQYNHLMVEDDISMKLAFFNLIHDAYDDSKPGYATKRVIASPYTFISFFILYNIRVSRAEIYEFFYSNNDINARHLAWKAFEKLAIGYFSGNASYFPTRMTLPQIVKLTPGSEDQAIRSILEFKDFSVKSFQQRKCDDYQGSLDFGVLYTPYDPDFPLADMFYIKSITDSSFLDLNVVLLAKDKGGESIYQYADFLAFLDRLNLVYDEDLNERARNMRVFIPCDTFYRRKDNPRARYRINLLFIHWNEQARGFLPVFKNQAEPSILPNYCNVHGINLVSRAKSCELLTKLMTLNNPRV